MAGNPFSLGKLERKLGREYGDWLFKLERKALGKGLVRRAGLAKFFSSISPARRFRNPDGFFFKAASLPAGGKEYWFINIVSTQGGNSQLVLTFGRSDGKTTVNGKAAHGDRVATVGWLYSGGKKVFLEKSLRLQCAKGLLKTDSFSFRGAYPTYELVAGNNKLRLSKPERGVPYEAVSATVGALGIGMLTMYLDAKGTIGGKKFEGVGYVQKVVVVAPFIPWNWVRLVFADRSVLDFFTARLSRRDEGYGIMQTATYRLASGKTFALGRGRLRRLGPNRWLLEGKDFSASMKTYASKPFLMRGRGEFHYDEHMVECADFTFKNASKPAGIGIIEDAYGLLL
ncbi:hypothetical protein HY095_05405 [Candidatus Micrarchaeota archaeon]|nr:hypothetical protein [Candidatus Micrarchaeota archaeon]